MRNTVVSLLLMLLAGAPVCRADEAASGGAAALVDCSRYEKPKGDENVCPREATGTEQPTQNTLAHDASVRSLEGDQQFTEAAFLSALREETLRIELTHLEFRDAIDVNLAAPDDVIISRVEHGAMPPSMLSVPSDCLAPYPKLLAQQKQAQKMFFEDAGQSRARRELMKSRLAGLFLDGDTGKDAKSCSRGFLCKPVQERAAEAYRLSQALETLRSAPSPGTAARQHDLERRLDEMMAEDPALFQRVALNPGDCPPEVGRGDILLVADETRIMQKHPGCTRFFDFIGSTYVGTPAEPQRGLPGVPPLPWRAAELAAEYYPAANRQTKALVVDAIHRTCRDDSAEMVLNPAISAGVLMKYPQFAPQYCRLFARESAVNRHDEKMARIGAIVGWGCTAATAVINSVKIGASVVGWAAGGGEAAGGAAAGTAGLVPLAAAAGALATSCVLAGPGGFLFSNKYEKDLRMREFDRTIQSIGALTGTPTEAARIAAEIKEADDVLHKQMKAAIIGAGLQSMVSVIGFGAEIHEQSQIHEIVQANAGIQDFFKTLGSLRAATQARRLDEAAEDLTALATEEIEVGQAVANLRAVPGVSEKVLEFYTATAHKIEATVETAHQAFEGHESYDGLVETHEHLPKAAQGLMTPDEH